MATPLIPPYDGFVYHPHQSQAIHWMAQREATDAQFVNGGILAHEMGLGKTWTSIGHILNSPPSHTLILVPPVLQSQWEEALVHARIAYDVMISAKRTAAPSRRFVSVRVEDARPGYHVTLGTYVRAAKQSDALITRAPFDRLLCDEGHILRNGRSNSTYRKLEQLVIPSRWILSGTPVQNSKRDFTHLCMFLGMDRVNARRLDQQSEIASVIVSRYTIDTAGESVAAMLPPTKPTHHVHPIVMPTDSDEAQTFKSLVGRFNLAVERHAKTMIVLELYLRIRQFLAHPAIYVDAMKRKYGERYTRTEWNGTASKMDTFASFMNTTPQESTIVFCNFREEMDRAAAIVDAAGYKVYKVAGGMSEFERAAVVGLSREDSAAGIPVCMIVQIIAGGAGLNLQHCNRVVFLSSHWNPAIVDQAIARAYRMGQTRAVSVHHFLTANGDERNVDRIMMGLHAKKRRTAAEIHAGFACSTAISADMTLLQLDDVLATAPPELSDELLDTQTELHDPENDDLLASQHVVEAV